MLTTATRYTLATEFVLAPDECIFPLPAPEPLRRGVVYLLHFERRISDKHTTQHYIGWTTHLPSRALAHLRGRGARLTQVARERGIGFVIADTWPGDRSLERRMKNRKNGKKLCPICEREQRSRISLPVKDLEWI